MNQIVKYVLVGTLTGLGATACVVQSPPAHAQYREEHPAYLHALSDLRAARWLISHRPADNYAMGADEQGAIAEIDAAIGEIKHAAFDDGKNLDDHPQVDAALNHSGRLHKAAELLRKVHNDVAREEDDPHARGLQHRSLQHIDAAAGLVDRSLADTDR